MGQFDDNCSKKISKELACSVHVKVKWLAANQLKQAFITAFLAWQQQQHYHI